ncbi:protein kinase [Streptomyces purpureus]|uniref:serine/threonine-protein kinase n=1 Tax=Streptomyces purpureus TaxID=1951 RepID=UPI0037928302
MQPLEAGEPRTIGAYRLLGRLGAGGMGRVYLARSEGGRTVAVKVVHPHFALDEQFRARFRREVAAARRVGGAWTAPVLDADPDAPVPWVATGYVAGPPLSQAVTEHGPLPEVTVRALGAGLAEALTAVHALGLVHRDVKPSNVLLALDGPRLIDFGIARATEGTASLTSTGVSVGSPGYMAPEQILGTDATAAADVFSLGAVLAYAATGGAPFPGESSAALLYKVVHEEPELGDAGLLDGALRELVVRCLAKDPAARPATEEIARVLAPGGAAAAIQGGWLPGPLVEQVSLAAVRLLDLEPAATEPGASGPVPFTSPAIGVFGPPLEPADPYTSGQYASGPPTAGGSATGPYVTDPGPYGPVPAPRTGADTTQGPGRVSVSLTTSSERGPRKSRRLSCTVALAVAGSMAAVTLGGLFLFDLLPGGRDASNAGGSGSTRPPAATQSDPAEKPGAVPAAYIGTWKGPFKVTLAGSELQAGTFTVVLTRGSTGQKVGTVNQFDALGNFSCEDNLVLREVTERELVAEGTASDKAGNTCTGDKHTVKLKLASGKLTYTSDEARAGNPRATLERSR